MKKIDISEEYFMGEAIKQAKISYKSLDVPVGAVIVQNNKIIAKAHNLKEKKKCAIYHAEILAIEKACKKVKNFRLCDCDIYITKEPCVMCLGAILSARIENIYFGASDKKFGISNIVNDIKFNHKCNIQAGICEKECEEMLSEFFKKIRGDKCKSRLKNKS